MSTIRASIAAIDNTSIRCNKKECKGCEKYHGKNNTALIKYVAKRIGCKPNELVTCAYALGKHAKEICSFGDQCKNLGRPDHEAATNHDVSEFMYCECTYGAKCRMLTENKECIRYHADYETRAEHLNRVGYPAGYGHAFSVKVGKEEYIILYSGWAFGENATYLRIMQNLAVCPYKMRCTATDCMARHPNQFCSRGDAPVARPAGTSPTPSPVKPAAKPTRSSMVCGVKDCKGQCGFAHTFREYEPAVCACTDADCQKFHYHQDYMNWFTTSIAKATPTNPGENPWVINRLEYLMSTIGTAQSFVPNKGETSLHYVNRLLKGSNYANELNRDALQKAKDLKLAQEALDAEAAKTKFATNLAALQAQLAATQDAAPTFASLVAGTPDDPELAQIGYVTPPTPNFHAADEPVLPAAPLTTPPANESA
jgi:hypothetical protein